MELAFFNEVKNVWDRYEQNELSKVESFNIKIYKKFIGIFHVGNFYYYIFDIARLKFSFMSPEIKKVLGYEAEDMDVAFFISKIHPDDQAVFLNHENTVVDFFKKLPLEKIPFYKVSYDYRVQHKAGNYVRILQQVVTLQHDDDKNVQVTLGVHTDITHFKSTNTSTLSFIGLNNEPSYYNVEVAQLYKPSKQLFTKREKEILSLLLKGLQTTAIAEKLFISKYTVNTHRKNILSKTNTKSTVELLNKVINEGLI